MAINFTTFFSNAGKAFFSGNTTNTAGLTTVPTEVEDYVIEVSDNYPVTALESLDIDKTMANVARSVPTFQAAARSLNDTVIRQSLQTMLITLINLDNPQPSLSVGDAIEQLISQMNSAGETVDETLVTCAATFSNTAIDTGTDDTSTNAAFLTDTTASFRVNGLIGHVLHNVTDGSSGVVTANTATTVTATLSGGSENDWDSGEVYSINTNSVGDGVIVCETKRGDGLENEHIFGEPVEGTFVSTDTDGSATVELSGQFLAASKMAVDWPLGSGSENTITSSTAAGTNLVNGAFEEEEDESADLPSGWIAETATLGTTLKLTPVEIQTVIISGSPTGGFYTLSFTDRNSVVQTTIPLAFDAGSSAVQSALRSLTGLSNITIVESGSTPDFTHTITFTDVPNPGQLTNGGVGDLTGGAPAIAHATTTAGSANIMRGARALEFDGDGAQNTDIYHSVEGAVENQQFAFNVWALADVTPAAGVLTISLVDGINGTIINDDQGVANSTTIDCTALTQAFVASNTTFRIPITVPPVIYLRVEVTTAISSGSSVFLDEMVLKEMDLLYTSGVSISAFSGIIDWSVDDLTTITPTNNRGGQMHEWMNRVFDLDTRGLLLPTETAPGTQPDTLIS